MTAVSVQMRPSMADMLMRALLPLGEESDPHRLMRGIAQAAGCLAEATVTRLWALDVSREQLYLEAVVGEAVVEAAAPPPLTTLKLADGRWESHPLIHTVRNGGLTRIADIAVPSGFDCSSYWTHENFPPGTSLLVSPLRNRDAATFGVIEFWDCPVGRWDVAETQDRLELVRIFCRQAAVLCENAHLRNEWVRRTGQPLDAIASDAASDVAPRRLRRVDWSAHLVGGEDAMGYVWDLLDRVASKDTTVLLRGETGTGKEVAARALHRHSPRSGKPFVAQNCAAIPEALLESELFGYQRGAFSGAAHDHCGLLLAADGGTLFLDEIGDMPLTLQGKLLRVLQERCVRPLGGFREISLDIRLIAATHADLEQAVALGRFRQDLFYRLSVFPVVMPPLRVRGTDILVLARHFLASGGRDRIPELGDDVQKFLLSHPFPGNIRQLKNMLERALVVADGPELSVVDLLGDEAPATVPALHDDALSLREAVDSFERDLIERKLAWFGGHQERTAQALGIPRRTLADKLRKYGLARYEPARAEEAGKTRSSHHG